MPITAATYAIITKEDAKTYLNKAVSDTSDDDFLQTCVNTVSGAIERFINGPVKEQTYTDQIYDGSDKNFLILRHWPLTALKTPGLADVQWRTAPDQAWENLETEVKFILIKTEKPYALWLWRMVFPKGDANIKLSYKAGYNPIPDDIIKVCLEGVAEMYKESSRGDGRLGRESVSKNSGGGSATDSFYQLSERHQTVLMRYRKVTV